MKLEKNKLKLLVIGLLSLSFGQAFSQFEIPKHSINNGSTNMQGGDFKMSSSVGQVDASETLAGADYELRGGFWSGIESPQNNDLIFKDDFEQ